MLKREIRGLNYFLKLLFRYIGLFSGILGPTFSPRSWSIFNLKFCIFLLFCVPTCFHFNVTALLVHMDLFTIRWPLEDVICPRKGIQVSRMLNSALISMRFPVFQLPLRCINIHKRLTLVFCGICHPCALPTWFTHTFFSLLSWAVPSALRTSVHIRTAAMTHVFT